MKQFEIRPLTYIPKKGKRKGKPYERLSAVEAKIREALTLNPLQLQEQIKIRDYRTDGFIQEECLVYLIRVSRREENFEMVQTLVMTLIDRIKHYVDERVRFPLVPCYVDDCYNDVIGEVVGHIIDVTSDNCDFAEVRFWVWLDRQILNVLKKYILRQRTDFATESIDKDDSEENDFTETPEILRDKTMSADLQAFIWEALEVLDEREKLVFVMRHYLDWEIKNQDMSMMTISKYFGVSDSLVRRWFRKINEKLENWQKGRMQ